MGTTESVIGESFWSETKPVVLSPEVGLEEWLDRQSHLLGHVLFKTSGSTGHAKYVCLSRAALRASAAMVNDHLQATEADVWLGVLPEYHVGGFGVAARASLLGCGVVLTRSEWSPRSFCEEASICGATLTSLVPTQVFDLVDQRCQAPSTLRAVLVGGGNLEPDLEERARALGWPLLKTFGMTETASQVATQAMGSDQEAPMMLLLGWEAHTNEDSLLRVRGDALFSGYVWWNGKDYHFDDTGEWFLTSDFVRLKGRQLEFVGRSQHRLKIKGELVHLAALRLDLERVARALGVDPLAATLIAVSHPRDEHALVLITEKQLSSDQHLMLQNGYNERAIGLVRLFESFVVPELPRTSLGKLREAELQQMVDALTSPNSLP
ncbi:MAG: O-succinylbenzoic acid--CoA ligase [Verrucomicrobiales bacterium]|jgi:O-succinylbenzoic acid--CoA ligase